MSGLDSSDATNLLLQTASQNGDSSMEDSASDGSSPQDWAQLSTLWDGSDPNSSMKYAELMDYSLPMDMEFDPTMGLDASALQYNYAYDPTSAFQNMGTDLLPPHFPFTFQSALNASVSSFSSGESSSGSSTDGKQRRLSITSSSSSSGASLAMSPGAESSPSPPSEAFSPQPSTPKLEVKQQEESPMSFDPAVELAERVRQTAGVMLAVPMSAQLQALSQTLDLSQMNVPSKLPTPRLPRQAASPQSTSSSAASTPPPSTPPMSSSLPSKLTINTKPVSSASTPSSTLPTPTTAMMPSGSLPPTTGRPKTSHTTIERRYRTNLNARIQSLRMAVPALRVLEDRDGGNGKKIKKNLKDGVYVKGAGIGIDGEDGTVDVIDERGFVDGVKVARKCSKANVLGKAVEYIRVLKKREIRLKAEHNGLKALLSGLVGGSALLKEWEQRWRERFGGEEKDEVEGEEAEDFDSDDEDGEDGDEEVGKKRKRAKTAASSPAALPFKKAVDRKAAATAPPPSVANVITQLGGTAPGAPAVPEKRKRGRPRKVPAPPTPVATLAPQGSQPPQDVIMQQHDQVMFVPSAEEQQQQHTQPQQYLLAVFALFSFFNSPLPSSYGFSSGASSSHHHTGVLLNNPPLALAPEIISQFIPVSNTPAVPVESATLFVMSSWPWKECVQSFHLLVSVLVLGSFVCSWMGLSIRKKGSSTSADGATLKRNVDGNVDWTAVCHDTVLNSDKDKALSLVSKARMYASLLTQKNASVTHITSFALSLSSRTGNILLSGPARAKARSLWASAQAQIVSSTPVHKRNGATKLSERLVLEQWGVEEALVQLEGASAKERKGDGELMYTPIEVLGCRIVKQRVKQHLGQLFIDAVGVSSGCEEAVEEKSGLPAAVVSKEVEMEMRRTVEAARELGGDVEELGRTFERVWKGRSGSLEDVSLQQQQKEGDADDDDTSTTLDEEIKSLLTGLVLYRRVFAGPAAVSVTSVLLSPPPSPTSRSRSSKEGGGDVLLDLRTALGNRVFEDGEDEMEVARDRVVDLIAEMERRGRSPSP